MVEILSFSGEGTHVTKTPTMTPTRGNLKFRGLLERSARSPVSPRPDPALLNRRLLELSREQADEFPEPDLRLLAYHRANSATSSDSYRSFGEPGLSDEEEVLSKKWQPRSGAKMAHSSMFQARSEDSGIEGDIEELGDVSGNTNGETVTVITSENIFSDQDKRSNGGGGGGEDDTANSKASTTLASEAAQFWQAKGKDTRGDHVPSFKSEASQKSHKSHVSLHSIASPISPPSDFSMPSFQDIEVARDLEDPGSPVARLLRLHSISDTDGRYSSQRLAELKAIATKLYNQTYKPIGRKDYLTYLGGGKPSTDEYPLDRDLLRLFYLSCFRWTRDVLGSLRLLCDRLFFKGESQCIDRVLDSFAQNWYDACGVQNGRSLYGSANGVYLVAYSLIILNTDLHTKHSERTVRLSKPKFVKNTIIALRQNDAPIDDYHALEHELKKQYEELSSHELPLVTEPIAKEDRIDEDVAGMGGISRVKSASSAGSNTGTAASRHMVKKKSSITEFFKKGAEKSEREKAPEKSIADTISTRSFDDSLITGKPIEGFGFVKAIRAEARMLGADGSKHSAMSVGGGSSHTLDSADGSILTRFVTNQSTPLNPDSSLIPGALMDPSASETYFVEEDGDVKLELQGPPWVKEGMQSVVLSKSILQGINASAPNGQAARSRRFGFFHRPRKSSKRSAWKQYFTVVAEGQLRFYSFGDSSKKRGGGNSFESKGDGNWLAQADCVASVTLNSCYTQFVSPKSKLHTYISSHMAKVDQRTGDETFWVLNLPLNDPDEFKNYRRIFFCASTSETAHEFCDTCNFWAARTSSTPPEEESISSSEFGWSEQMLQSLSERTKTKNGRTALDNYLSIVNVQKWRPVIYGLIPAELSMIQQLRALKKYYCALEMKHQQHQDLEVFHTRLDNMDRANEGNSSGLFGKGRHSEKTVKNVRTVRANYANRLNYLANEMTKYKCYILALQNAIVLRRTRLAQLEKVDNAIAEEDEEDLDAA